MSAAYEIMSRAGSPGRRVSVHRSRQSILGPSERDQLLAISTHAVRNNPEARAMIRRQQQFVVGPRGAKIQADTGDEDLDARLDALWQMWAFENGDFRCDSAGLKTFPMMQKAVIEEDFVGGRSLHIMITDGDAHGSLQSIESQRITNPNGAIDTEGQIAGLTIEPETGEILGYNVSRYMHGGAWLSTTTDAVEAADAIYCVQPMDSQIGVYAPEPILGISALTIAQTSEFLMAVTEAGKTQALTPMVHKRGPASTAAPLDEESKQVGDAGYSPDGQGRSIFNFVDSALGFIADLAPGDELINPRMEMPSGAIKPLIDIQLKRIAMGIGYGPQLLTGDFSSGSFSVARLAVQFARAVRDDSYEAMIRDFVTPARRHMIDSAMRLKLLDPPMSDDVDLYKFKHSPPPLPDPDPAETAQTNGYLVARGHKTMKAVLAERGEDLDDHVKELAAEITKFEQAGLVHPSTRDDSGEDAQLTEPRPAEIREADGTGGGKAGTDGSGELIDQEDAELAGASGGEA